MCFSFSKASEQFLVFRREGNDLARGNRIVALASNYICFRPTYFHFDLSKTSVEIRVRTPISKRITRADFVINTAQPRGYVIGILYKLAASIARNSVQQILLSIHSFVSRDVEDAFTSGGSYSSLLTSCCRDSRQSRGRHQRARLRRSADQAARVDHVNGNVS